MNGIKHDKKVGHFSLDGLIIKARPYINIRISLNAHWFKSYNKTD